MDDKVAYVFAEKKPIFGVNWIGICSEQGIYAQNPEGAARQLRKLRKEGYKIIDVDVPLGGLVYRAYNYRDIDESDRKILNHWDKEWEHRENYPGLFRKELDILKRLKKSRIEEGALWVSDVSFYPKGELDTLIYEMGEHFAHRTTYFLAADSEPRLVGRIDLGQYITLIRYFAEHLSLRNSSEEYAKKITSLGRPLDERELEQIIESGIRVHS